MQYEQCMSSNLGADALELPEPEIMKIVFNFYFNTLHTLLPNILILVTNNGLNCVYKNYNTKVFCSMQSCITHKSSINQFYNRVLLHQWFVTFFAPWAPKSKKFPRTPTLSRCNTGRALDVSKRGLKGYNKVLYLCDLRGPPVNLRTYALNGNLSGY